MLAKDIYDRNRYNFIDRDYSANSPFLLDVLIIGSLIIGCKILNVPALMFVLLFYIICKIIVSEPQYTLAYLLILIPNLGVIFIPGIPSPLLNILIPVAIFKMLISNGKMGINRKLSFLTFILILYEYVHAFAYSLDNLITLASWIFTIFYVLLFMSSRHFKYDHGVSIKYFISGICISSAYGLYINFMRSGSLLSFSRVSVTDRFIGAAGDPNYYSVYILIGLFSLLKLIDRNRNLFSRYMYNALFVLLPLFGFMSLSRMFIIVFTIVGIIYLMRVFISVKKYKKHKKFAWKIIGLCIPLVFIFPTKIMDNINLILSRFTMYRDDLTLLTSHRNLIAKNIIDFLISNPFYMLFGVGIQNYGQRVGHGIGYAHNIILELLVAYGFFGTVLFIIYLITLVVIERHNNIKKHSTLVGWLPVICMMISYMSINAIEVESFYILVIYGIKNIYYCSDKVC